LVVVVLVLVIWNMISGKYLWCLPGHMCMLGSSQPVHAVLLDCFSLHQEMTGFYRFHVSCLTYMYLIIFLKGPYEFFLPVFFRFKWMRRKPSRVCLFEEPLNNIQVERKTNYLRLFMQLLSRGGANGKLICPDVRMPSVCVCMEAVENH